MEDEVGKKDVEGRAGKGGKRQNPSWVGIWRPRASERVPYSLQKTVAMISVPGLKMEIGNLLESAHNFYKASSASETSICGERGGRVGGEICLGEMEKTGESRGGQVGDECGLLGGHGVYGEHVWGCGCYLDRHTVPCY